MSKQLINLSQIGLSPKVKVPGIVALGVGVAVLGVGLAIGEDTVINIGAGVLATCGITVPLGYRAPTGTVELDVGEASDALLDRALGRSSATLDPDEPVEDPPQL